jgi:hypothetical protein
LIFTRHGNPKEIVLHTQNNLWSSQYIIPSIYIVSVTLESFPIPDKKEILEVHIY